MNKTPRLSRLCAFALMLVGNMSASAFAQTIDQLLSQMDPTQLEAQSLVQGNAARGAILFHGPLLGCAKCHSVTESGPSLLGPNLSLPRPEESNQKLIQSVLNPSAEVAQQYRQTIIATEDGQILSGLLVGEERESQLTLRMPDTLQDITIHIDEIAAQKTSPDSLMPAGILRGLTNVAEFYDLLKYLVEIRDAGSKRARELQPTSAQLAIQLPDYESRIDHAGMISDWDDAAFKRGEEIYKGLCVNCHGTLSAPGSLATAMRFGEGKFKFGSDPYAMYQTLSRGGGLMLPQPWMVPQQKYDVIHYLREAYLKERNEGQLFQIDEAYLQSLPEGDERGPAPRKIEPWSQADYGPRLVNTYELGKGGRNIAQKGIAVQLDSSPGGIAHGRAWSVFDHDTMRLAGVWTDGGFIDWHGIHFDGRHGVHPHVAGDLMMETHTGPGWAEPETGSLKDDVRVLGRDGKYYGPLPRKWAQFKGIYQNGSRSVISYRVGSTDVLETHSMHSPPGGTANEEGPSADVFLRHVRLQRREQPLEMVIAASSDASENWSVNGQHATLGAAQVHADTDVGAGAFDGSLFYEISDDGQLDMLTKDFTIRIRIRTEGDGTLFARTPSDDSWAPGGQSLFLRGGRLTFDVGWVGALQGKTRIDDGKWHQVAVGYRSKTGLVSLWVDGRLDGKRKLQPEEHMADAVFRIGRTAKEFPGKTQLTDAVVSRVEFFDRELREADIATEDDPKVVWDFANGDTEGSLAGVFADSSTGISSGLSTGMQAKLVSSRRRPRGQLHVGIAGGDIASELVSREGKLLLKIPAGAPVTISVWHARLMSNLDQEQVHADVVAGIGQLQEDLFDTKPGQDLFPEKIVTEVEMGADQGGFAVDYLRIPLGNPWRSRVRTSGLDFFSDGDRMAVSTWDGDVWIVSGLSKLDGGNRTAQLEWKRVAFGLFQPLGVKVIDDTIFLTCRDQLLRLDDVNGDGTVDYYHCVNSDHQVTEHFHEFAMGLQTDAEGNFYYAKSARHALTALVPHHGTLLRVSKDGGRTDILAKGFRAANGVCMNPDGSFIVTDQEGHWNPKNRINWVRPGGFYGNMYGYHDVTDDADDAMEQPLCWITNKFDRSPAELLWVDSHAWGPLKGQLLNLSYGYGKLFVVPHENIGGQMQGGMCQLPIADLPTGTMRGRFSPFDGQLYVCGLAAWATNQTMQEGGLYRVRYTGKPVALPVQLNALESRMVVTLSEPLHEATSVRPEDFEVRVWALKRTKNYGSKHFDEHELTIERVELTGDRRQLVFHLEELEPTWCMEIRMALKTSDGREVERVINNTVHQVPMD